MALTIAQIGRAARQEVRWTRCLAGDAVSLSIKLAK
jgi:hypothetical protein